MMPIPMLVDAAVRKIEVLSLVEMVEGRVSRPRAACATAKFAVIVDSLKSLRS